MADLIAHLKGVCPSGDGWSAADLAHALGGRKSHRGRMARCPAHDDRIPSLSISEAADGKILVKCFAGCAQTRVIGALRDCGLWPTKAWHRGKIIRPQMRRFAHDLHGPKCEVLSGTDDYEGQQRDKGRYFYRSSRAASGTPVEVYLRSRGIRTPLPSTVRFLPPNKPGYHPAMIVPYGLPQEPKPDVLDIAEDAITAVQLTLLKADGSGKAEVKPNKITIASPAGMPIVLSPVNDLMGLAVAEGIEDALSINSATGLGVWASGGASFMPKLSLAVPDYVEAVTIYAHDDAGGQRGARDLADALVARGIEVFVEGMML